MSILHLLTFQTPNIIYTKFNIKKLILNFVVPYGVKLGIQNINGNHIRINSIDFI